MLSTAASRSVNPEMTRTTFLRLEWSLSIVLLAVSAAWARARGLPLAALLTPHARDVAAGVAVGALLWSSIPLLRRAPVMARLWDTVLAPFARTLSVGDAITVAALSGISEEILFRGVLLPETGLLASSAVFGVLHALNRVYALWAAVIGALFAALALATGTLIAPIVAHATYNLGALLFLRRPDPASAASRSR